MKSYNKKISCLLGLVGFSPGPGTGSGYEIFSGNGFKEKWSGDPD